MKRRIRVCASGILVLSAVCARLLGGDALRTPLLRVPKIDRPPTIDGTLGEDEYARFAAITGMVHWKPRRVIPKVQQVVWYLAYDAEALYLAMDSPSPEGTWPVARVKPEDALERSIDYPLLHDDHVELQFGTYGRAKAALGGYGFYKIIANARAAVSDVHWYNGTPGSEELWDYGGEIACKVTENAWRLEMRIPLRAIGVDVDRPEGADGTRMPIQLVRADSSGGDYFAGWVGGTWMEWEHFGEIVLDPAAPSFRFLETGEMARGRMDLGFEMVNPTDRPLALEVVVSSHDGEGQPILAEKKRVEIAPGARRRLRLGRELALTEKGNLLRLDAYTVREGAERLVYRADLPIIHLTEAYYDRHVKPWLSQKPRSGEYKWTLAYWPSYGIVRGRLDLDLFGLDDRIRDAASWSMALRRKGESTVLTEAAAPVEDRAGDMTIETGKLAGGEYEVDLRLRDAGDKTVSERTASFVRSTYPWEGNEIGKAEVVIPPYTPIRVEGMTLRPWGRAYTLGQNGLPAQIVATGGRRDEEPILREPIRLEAEANGATSVLDDAGASIREATDARVAVAGEGSLAGAAVSLEGIFEYDGWYRVNLTVAPGETPATLDRLTLVLPLWERADTMYVQRAGDSIGPNRMGAIPPGDGVVWDSSGLLKYGRDWGTFAPIVFAGCGDKGLWWFAEENRDWSLSATRPAIEYVRTDGGVDVRIHFLAAPVTIDRPRRIAFVLLASPVKPVPEDYRRRAWYADRTYFGHSTEGYRTYGQSVDGFEIYEDEHYEALRKHLLEGRTNYSQAAREGKPVVLYGSTWMCGLGLKAFDTYGGEWLGSSDWSPRPDTTYKGRWNLQHSRTFETPRDLTPLGVNWTESFTDCHVWWHKRLLERCPVNGTWWDNAAIGVIRDYDPERKAFYSRFNVFTRRRLTKRLATMCHELGREPCWLMNMHVDFSFCQYAWHVENDFYPLSPEGDLMDVLSVDNFRALCRTKHGIVPQLDSKMVYYDYTREQLRHMGRTAYGLCLLHDIGGRTLWNPQEPIHRELLKVMTDHVDFFDGAEFVPYWDNADVLTLVEPGRVNKPVPAVRDDLRVSVFRDGKRAMLVVMNVSGEPAPYPRFVLAKDLLGRRVVKVIDAETGTGWRQAYDHWFTYEDRFLELERHGLMLLAVE